WHAALAPYQRQSAHGSLVAERPAQFVQRGGFLGPARPFLRPAGFRPPAGRGIIRVGRLMSENEKHLRVLIANEKRERLDILAQVVSRLGHEVIAREIYVKAGGAATERDRREVAV